jgi:hypothetical protein
MIGTHDHELSACSLAGSEPFRGRAAYASGTGVADGRPSERSAQGNLKGEVPPLYLQVVAGSAPPPGTPQARPGGADPATAGPPGATPKGNRRRHGALMASGVS